MLLLYFRNITGKIKRADRMQPTKKTTKKTLIERSCQKILHNFNSNWVYCLNFIERAVSGWSMCMLFDVCVYAIPHVLGSKTDIERQCILYTCMYVIWTNVCLWRVLVLRTKWKRERNRKKRESVWPADWRFYLILMFIYWMHARMKYTSSKMQCSYCHSTCHFHSLLFVFVLSVFFPFGFSFRPFYFIAHRINYYFPYWKKALGRHIRKLHTMKNARVIQLRITAYAKNTQFIGSNFNLD